MEKWVLLQDINNYYVNNNIQNIYNVSSGVKLGNKDIFSTYVKVKMWHATVYLWELADFSSLSKLILSDD